MKTLLFVAAVASLLPSATGQTWTQTSAPVTNWVAVASSADGSKLAAAIFNGGIWVSTNSGGKWMLSGAPQEYWRCLASSADGNRLIAGIDYQTYTCFYRLESP